MPEASNVELLAKRYVAACESIYPVAVVKGDIRLAGLVARSALSVILNAADDLDPAFVKPTAIEWFERLTSLYKDEAQIPSDISRAIRWATNAMTNLFNGTSRNSSEQDQTVNADDSL